MDLDWFMVLQHLRAGNGSQKYLESMKIFTTGVILLDSVRRQERSQMSRTFSDVRNVLRRPERSQASGTFSDVWNGPANTMCQSNTPTLRTLEFDLVFLRPAEILEGFWTWLKIPANDITLQKVLCSQRKTTERQLNFDPSEGDCSAATWCLTSGVQASVLDDGRPSGHRDAFTSRCCYLKSEDRRRKCLGVRGALPPPGGGWGKWC
ncbi:hypothetical protein JOB18_024846 [Solea senegalensis]|uniref:Uncharacterized protein n=1 Tax=Solea senegalensis TaxID=28829 RepID=A0AAV6PL11_SOLSE|nr:hypothetical protein JOB18_024846 [Solea senegalensis]